ncbi:AAA family ATPase [Georgenia muralis]|uniref:Pilus assembly protein CpaE n=1 Tax=Georgenia muralis TaxID=154117 RepID=A0A3N4Z493_9MICO|nr:AAA family ATPase [Georgenia muralis]RPF28109.1 pilus assembly protein CpaE [Georgenia muralis]
MTRVVLATGSPDLLERMHYATGGAFLALRGEALPVDVEDFFTKLGGAPRPDVVMLDADGETEHALGLAADFRRRLPGASVVLVSPLGSDLGLQALRAGVVDILHAEADIEAIRLVLDRASDLAARPVESHGHAPTASVEPGQQGKVISVMSPKGGVGKTTIATNLAIGLAESGAQSTVLVDLDIQFGDVASALDLEPDYTLPDVVTGQGQGDTIALKSFLTQHSSGLFVICGADSPAAADGITTADVSALLRSLADEFRFVVVDTAPGLTEHNLAVMDETSDLVLVTSMDVPGIRGLRKEIDTLDRLSMVDAERHIVVNLAEKGVGLDIKDVAVTLGTDVHVEIPRSKAVSLSVNQGIPILVSSRRDAAARQIALLVERFVPQADAQAANRGRHRLIGGNR